MRFQGEAFQGSLGVPGDVEDFIDFLDLSCAFQRDSGNLIRVQGRFKRPKEAFRGCFR